MPFGWLELRNIFNNRVDRCKATGLQPKFQAGCGLHAPSNSSQYVMRFGGAGKLDYGTELAASVGVSRESNEIGSRDMKTRVRITHGA